MSYDEHLMLIMLASKKIDLEGSRIYSYSSHSTTVIMLQKLATISTEQCFDILLLFLTTPTHTMHQTTKSLFLQKQTYRLGFSY